MNKLLLKFATMGAVGSLLASNPMLAQLSPTTPKAPRVRSTQGPEIEMSKEFLTIIRWTTNNPGGSPEHYGIVHYGTDPKNLGQTAKSPIRLNPDHASTIFRVRLDDLKPGTTYYYTVSSMEANGTDDGTKSTVKHFTTPGEPQGAGGSRDDFLMPHLAAYDGKYRSGWKPVMSVAAIHLASLSSRTCAFPGSKWHSGYLPIRPVNVPVR
jgi:hypothetical protein